MKKIIFFFCLWLLNYACQTGGSPAEAYGIAYYSAATGNGDIYVVNLDGTRKEQLTDRDSSEFNPRFNWQSRTLTFGVQQGESVSVFERPYKGADRFRLDNPAFEELPEWSPDGRRIVYTQKEGGHLDLFLADSTGQRIERLTADTFDNKQPVITIRKGLAAKPLTVPQSIR